MSEKVKIKWYDDNSCCYVMTCPKCGRKIEVYEEDQVPGFRDKSYLYCPYSNCDWKSEYWSMQVDHICTIA